MKQRRTSNLTRPALGVLLACAGACGDDGTEGRFGASILASGTAPATYRELMPGCTARDAGSVAAVAPSLVLTGENLNIWPPNHKFHSIDIAECVSIAGVCDSGLTAEFIWGSSDEPVDSIGDGHFAPDILFDDCGRAQVRSERQGPKDGRVYKLGVRVVDGAGLASETTCTVIVDHDQRGVVGADSGESYRVTPTDPVSGLPCDGRPDNHTPPPPPPPPVVHKDAGVPDQGMIGI